LKEWFPRFGRALWRAFIFMMLLQLALTPLTLLAFYIMETQGVTFTWFQAVVFKGIWGASLVRHIIFVVLLYKEPETVGI
jgi:hypothetical protein